MKRYYTYLHCKPDGVPFYVGKGHGKRCRYFGTGRNLHHRRIIAKYGKENIGVFVFSCESEQHAHADEIQQIAQLRREGFALVNQTDGGEGVSGLKHSPSTLAKMSQSKIGRKLSPEHVKKIADANRGKQTGLGRKHSVETRAKMSTTRKMIPGKIPSEETRAKLSASHLGQPAWNKGKASPFRGVPRSPETKAKISAAQTGKVLSEEHKKKLSIAHLGKIPWNKRQ